MAAATFDIPSFLRSLPARPGIYKMLDINDHVLYVGKARRLDKRVASYFQRTTNNKTQALISHICNIEIVIANSEVEALILESNLIKELRPKYNILLRDDKSYPYVYLSDHDYPRLSMYRGVKSKKGRYFGPYPSVLAVRETLNILQKVFKIRSCQDTFFRNRTRPCLQYQIKRCSAPCVAYISPQQYAEDLQNAVALLSGKSQQLLKTLQQQMEHAAENLNFEEAAKLRDQIMSIRQLQEKQSVDSGGKDTDIIALAESAGQFCIQVLFIRDGRLLGSKLYYPKTPRDAEVEEVLTAFITQFYFANLTYSLPKEILVNHAVADHDVFIAAIAERWQHKLEINQPQRGERVKWLEMAEHNAEQAIATKLASKASMEQAWLSLQKNLVLETLPKRMECFDISHSSGEATVASCVVFDLNGPLKSDYRRFNIKDITPGDDYAAMYQALQRRYLRMKKEDGKLPDILVIDGGKGQLTQAQTVLEELQIDEILLLGVAKGVTRKPGLETIFRCGIQTTPIVVKLNQQALHLIQQIRDEAHRFAITGHRQQRGKKRQRSVLEDIPGIGAKRRKALLQRFGGLQELAKASLAEIEKTEGISTELAKLIYTCFHD